MMDHFALRYNMSLRMPLTVFQWICRESAAAGIPPATYTVKRLKELAQQDLVKDSSDDPEAA